MIRPGALRKGGRRCGVLRATVTGGLGAACDSDIKKPVPVLVDKVLGEGAVKTIPVRMRSPALQETVYPRAKGKWAFDAACEDRCTADFTYKHAFASMSMAFDGTQLDVYLGVAWENPLGLVGGNYKNPKSNIFDLIFKLFSLF